MIGFTDDEKRLVAKMLDNLTGFQPANTMHEKYYDGSYSQQLLTISTPPNAARLLKTICGWAGTSVDVLEERLDFVGFTDDDLITVFDDNALDEESGQVHLDALIFGIGFVSVTTGADGEPETLIRGHDAKNTTGLLNHRTRMFDAALTREVKQGETVGVELWLPDQIVVARRDKDGEPWEVIDRQYHRLGAVPIVPFINRARTGDRGGKSEVTAPLRAYTDSAVRTLISMDVNREFFSVPQRYALGFNQEDFVGPFGENKSQWDIITGRCGGR